MKPRGAYYNEFDPFAAAWLRELIKAGHIAPGEVDERSIEDVVPNELAEFVQCHFFAGIGVWSYALRRAGWPDDRPVWTGSCPCQPFSNAGKGEGFADERHLWPAFFHLISQCRPFDVFGEQVASKDGRAWLDLVQADLEGVGYTCGAVDTCSAGFGAPHIRQRLYWVGYAPAIGFPQRGTRITTPQRDGPAGNGSVVRLGHTLPTGWTTWRAESGGGSSAGRGGAGGLEYSGGERRQRREAPAPGHDHDRPAPQRPQGQHGAGLPGSSGLPESRPGPTNGHWRAADWLFCRDGKWRPVAPGSFPLAHGAANRVGRLRGYGNAINAVQAEEFIRAYIEIMEEA